MTFSFFMFVYTEQYNLIQLRGVVIVATI